MAKSTKKCRVCGKNYEVCLSLNKKEGVFKWQEVACSPDCGSIYLAKIEASRNSVAVPLKEIVPEEKSNTSYYEDEIEDFDGDETEDFDDDETEDFDDEDEEV